MLLSFFTLLASSFVTPGLYTITPLRNHTAWSSHTVRPDDPQLSCYLEQSGLWRCVEDHNIAHDVDPDDSY